jgi:hypothetical protein
VVVHVAIPSIVMLRISEPTEDALCNFLDTTARTAEDSLSLEALTWPEAGIDHIATEGIHIWYVNVTWEPHVDVVGSATVQSISYQSTSDDDWASIRKYSFNCTTEASNLVPKDHQLGILRPWTQELAVRTDQLEWTLAVPIGISGI